MQQHHPAPCSRSSVSAAPPTCTLLGPRRPHVGSEAAAVLPPGSGLYRAAALLAALPAQQQQQKPCRTSQTGSGEVD